MATRIKLRRDTAANWLEQNPILAQGETGFETDTRAMKLGDGATRWADLKYAVTGDLKVTDDTIHGDTSVSFSSGIGNRENWIALTQANTGDVNDLVDAETDGVAVDSLGNIFSSYWIESTGTGLQKISPSGEVLWNNYYNEYASYGWGMAVDRYDNVIMILTEYDASSDDVVLMKVSGVDGSIIWQKYLNSYGDYDEYASCIDTDSQGNIFITGNAYNAGPDGNDAAYVAKFSGSNGSLIWSKQYDVDFFDSTGTGLSVDPDGNVGVVGSTFGPGGFVNMFKLDGSDGSILWQGKILSAKWNNGLNGSDGDVHFSDIESSDVAADAQGNFYVTFNWYSQYYAGVAALVAKYNGSTGKTEWVRSLTYENVQQSSGSIICDELNNVYVSSTILKYKSDYDVDGSIRASQHITKINTTGSIVWQRWLSKEQAATFDGKDNDWTLGQSIRVTKDYIVVAGNYWYEDDYQDSATDPYGGTNQDWYTQPYVAQLNRDGGEFEVNGWKFYDSSKDIQTELASIINDDNNWTYDPADVTNFDFNIDNGDVGYEMNTDTTSVSYINKSNVNKVTFSEKTLTLPKGGILDISRETNGYITAIGQFDGAEGSNYNGSVWLNGSARDDSGSTYAAGAWYDNTGNDWNNWNSYQNIPMVFKTDSTGKLIWQAGNALDQNWSNPEYVDVVYHPDTNTVITLGNDGELDGHEGFNIMYLDADTGSMKQDITHIRPADGSNDIKPRTLDVMSDGSPVVAGYITSTAVSYDDLTSGAAGLTGSTNSGTLVVLKNKFTVDGVTEYPNEDGTWALYPDNAEIYSVNRYGHDDAYPTVVYTGTLGSAATLDITVSGGSVTAVTVVAGGSGYKAGQKIKVLGTALGGATSANDLELFVNTVDGDGAITDFAGTVWPNAGAGADGTYTSVATTAVAGTLPSVQVRYGPEDIEYSPDIDNGGNGWGVGDTFKILGTQLGGATPANDLTFEVSSINGTGYELGGMTDITSISGTPQSTTIKLYGGGADYTQDGTYNVRHETGGDSFIWTPNWSKVFGTSTGGGTYLYDDLHAMTLDTSDNVIVGGYSDGTGLTGTWYSSGWLQTGIVAKFDSAGLLLWAKSIDGSEGQSTVWGVATDKDDNIYSVMTSNAEDDTYITKQTPDGDFVWQQSIRVDINDGGWSIDVADNGDVLVAGECWNFGWMDNDYHNNQFPYNWNSTVAIAKYDKDGNQLFARMVWSQNGVHTNNNNTYSNGITIKGDRFSFVAYSRDPGADNYQGIVIDLPLDGSGVGAYGDFHYQEVEIQRYKRFEDNNAGGYDIVSDITDKVVPRPYVFVDAPYVDEDAWRNVTIYGNRSAEIQTVYKPEGGEVKGVAKITFEDGSVQTTSMQGLPQVKTSQVNGGGNDYWIRPEDNGKHIYMKWGNTIFIPNPNRVELPIGFAITIITGNNNCGIVCENYDEYIRLSGDGGNGNNSYEIAYYTMVTIVKYESGSWMIAGPGLSSGW